MPRLVRNRQCGGRSGPIACCAGGLPPMRRDPYTRRKTMNFIDRFRIEPSQPVRLRDIDPKDTSPHKNKTSAEAKTQRYAERLRELQYLLYAEGRRGLLICLQAMDTGGKDGTIRHVLGYMNPQGCRVHTFKVPSVNRSHYEDVLVVRVHNLVPKEVWDARYDSINAFERYLSDNGVHILKFFLHISADEQLKRLEKRLSDPARHWKISEADYRERAFWDDYQQAYEDALNRCSTHHAPWFVVPADHKWFRNLVISRIVVDYLEQLKKQFPPPTVDVHEIERKYHVKNNGK